MLGKVDYDCVSRFASHAHNMLTPHYHFHDDYRDHRSLKIIIIVIIKVMLIIVFMTTNIIVIMFTEKGWLPIAKLKKIQVRIIRFGCNLGHLQRRSLAHLAHHQRITRRPQSNPLDPRTSRVNLVVAVDELTEISLTHIDLAQML